MFFVLPRILLELLNTWQRLLPTINTSCSLYKAVVFFRTQFFAMSIQLLWIDCMNVPNFELRYLSKLIVRSKPEGLVLLVEGKIKNGNLEITKLFRNWCPIFIEKLMIFVFCLDMCKCKRWSENGAKWALDWCTIRSPLMESALRDSVSNFRKNTVISFLPPTVLLVVKIG